jgi:trk system potassium uptake protein TrkH
MQLFRTESSDRSEKAMPRATQIAGATAIAYLVLSAACALSYRLAGMTGFEAVAHAMTTISTGGYSTWDASLGHFTNPSIHWIATVFMVFGALPFVVYIRAVRENPAALWQDGQVRHFLTGLAIAVLILALWLWIERGEGLGTAMRLAAFNVVSIVTTTGYASADYGQWGPFATLAFLFLTLIGGCTGSTSGGIKALRFEIAGIMIHSQMKRLFHPHGVFPAKYRGRPLPHDVTDSVINFLYVFFLSFVALTVALAALGLDFLTAASGAATAIANVGPGLGPVIGPAGNFAPLPDAAKWLLSVGMLMGRLEFLTVMVLFTRFFWRG